MASFVLIKDGLFPLSIDRDERAKYIDALEKADNHDYQDLIDVFLNNQIVSIEKALNWKIIEDSSSYDNVLGVLGTKLSMYRVAEEKQFNKLILQNMQDIFSIMRETLDNYKNDLKQKLDDTTSVDVSFCAPEDANAHYYARQIIEYANQYNYYVNLSLNKCWGRMFIAIDKTKKYRLVISIHHYGYDNSTFAIGAFLSKEIANSMKDSDNRTEYMDIPLGVPPLTMSSEKGISELKSSVQQQIKISIMSMLAYIANEL